MSESGNGNGNGDIKKFGPEQELAIISLAFDEPAFFSNIINYLKPEHFTNLSTQYVYTIIASHYMSHGVVLTRELCRDEVMEKLTTDDDYQPILDLINRYSNVREAPIVKEKLVEWARSRAYDKIYSDEAIMAHEEGNFDYVRQIIDEANKITDQSAKGLWFFENIDLLFKPDNEIKLTTGFPRLDAVINEGGPTYGDVFCWTGATGTGKSFMLINNAIGALRKGLNVLYVTLELSDLKSALRAMGSMTDIPIRGRTQYPDVIKNSINKFYNTHKSELIIYEFPPDEICINDVKIALDDTRKKLNGRNLDVVIIDYLELMLSKEPAYNKIGDEYNRQKRVSTEIRQFARKEKVLTFTASQTNRQGTAAAQGEKKGASVDSVIDLNKLSESYGKAMPLDYIVTINQTREEYVAGFEKEGDENSPNTKAVIRFYVAKNRNGPKFKIINARINYETMKVKEDEY